MHCFKFMMLIIGVSISLTQGLCGAYPPRFEGEFEEYGNKRLDLVAKFLPEHPVIFEAGGHYGNDTKGFAQKWPTAQIITFEPNPHAYEVLLAATNGLSNISAYNLAVSDYNGFATLNVCYGTTGDNPIFEGASSLLDASDWMKIHYGGPKVEVPCVVLDNWCMDNNVRSIDFMWLDLEGMELQVLKSSPLILENVKVIYTETNFLEFRQGMTQYKDLKAFLESVGFVLVAHWYREGLQGDAIFVKKEIYYLGFEE